MLRYYSYYSVGGYKDFMLGTSESKEKETFYLPMIPILEDRAQDEKDRKKIEDMKALPSIKHLSDKDSYGLPKVANRLISHAAYKIIYTHLEDDKYALSIRDIRSEGTDETGRNIPFMFLITGENKEDVSILNKLATYMAGNIVSTEKIISEVLHMDLKVNGLKFELDRFNTWIKDVLVRSNTNKMITINGTYSISGQKDTVSLLVLPSGITKEKAITEQKLETKFVNFINENDIVSMDNPTKLAEMLVRVNENLINERKRSEAYRKGMVFAALGGLIAGGIAGYFLSK